MGFVMTKYWLIHMIFHYMLCSQSNQHYYSVVTSLGKSPCYHSFLSSPSFPTLSDLPRDPAGPVVLLAAAVPVLANAMSNLIPNHILLPIIIQKGPEPFGKVIPLLLLLLSEEEGVVRTVVPELPLPLEEGRDGGLGIPGGGGRAPEVVPQEGERGAAAVSRQPEDGDGAAGVDVVVEVVAKVGRAHAHP